jgi:flagellar protein FlaF
MAGAEIIGAAIGVLLLILVGYLMIGSALTTAEVVTSAQKDITIQNEARLQTVFAISGIYSTSSKVLTVNIVNSGSETIGDFSHMDVYVTPSGGSPVYHSFSVIPGGVAGSSWSYTGISPDNIHPGMLDPDETMVVTISGFESPGFPSPPTAVSVSTATGVTRFAYIS